MREGKVHLSWRYLISGFGDGMDKDVNDNTRMPSCKFDETCNYSTMALEVTGQYGHSVNWSGRMGLHCQITGRPQ